MENISEAEWDKILTEPLAEYSSLSDWSSLLLETNKPSPTVYSDASYLRDLTSENNIIHVEQMTNTNVVSAWQKVVRNAKDGKITETDLRDVLKIACNLQGRGRGDRILLHELDYPAGAAFDNSPDTVPLCVTGASNIPQILVNQGGGQGAEHTDSESLQAKAISFICMFLMRTVSKPSDNLKRSLNQVKQSFGRVYGVNSTTIQTIEISDYLIDQVCYGMQVYRKIKKTLSYIIAAADKKYRNDSLQYGLLRYIIIQHIEFTGMRIYKMTMNIINGMPAITLGTFLDWVLCPESADAVKLIMKVAKEYDDPTKSNRTSYWKYARLVSDTYFLEFSMARNKYFGYVLARLMIERGLATINDYDSPLRIKAFESLGEYMKDEASRVAKIVIQLYNRVEASDTTNYRIARGIGRSANRPRPRVALDRNAGEGTSGQGNREEEAENAMEVDARKQARRAEEDSEAPAGGKRARANQLPNL